MIRDKVQILIVDDHAVLRTGLRVLIAQEPDLEVVGEAADGTEAVEQARLAKPDLVLVDLAMSNQTGIPTITQLRKEHPQLRILVLTMYADPAYLRMTLAAGSHGYLTKRSAHTEMLTAIRTVAAGARYIDHHFDANTVLEATLSRRRNAPMLSTGVLAKLSPREREVFELLARGFTNRQIAEQLNIRVKSAESYRARLMEKLELRTRADLVRYALGCGLLAAH
jgi:two-component system, NarL family, response regulator NreC